jgi:multidrug resistance efflux pump
MPIQNPSDIRLTERNDLEAVIGSPPGWMLRWGMTALLLVFALLLAISWFVQYPDVVEAPAVLTTENPPIRLAAGASAKISELKVKNGQTVQAGDLLAVLDNPARHGDVLRLEDFLENLTANESQDLLSVNLPEGLQLGSLQAGFAKFSQSFRDLQYFLKQDINYLKVSNLRKQIAEIMALNQSLVRQENILAGEVALTRKSAERDSILFSKNSLSLLEYEQSQAAWLRSRRELEALRSGTAQNNLRIRQMEAQILDLQQLQSDNKSGRMLTFQANLQRLQGDIAAWKQSWLLVAPIGGEVALTKAWSEQQFVREGEEVLTIVPLESSGMVMARALLAYEGSGKVKPGMPAHIRLDGYPYQEFGVLNGEVERIAAVPGEQGYEVAVSVPGDLKTSYGRAIPFRQEMQGTARIVTEERSLLTRILEKIVSAVKN